MCSASQDFSIYDNLCTCGASIPPSLAKREQRPERIQMAKFLDHSLHQKWVTKRDKPAPTYCCSPDIGWEKLGSDNIHECKVCCSKEFSCKKTQILNILRISDPDIFERGESHRQGQMPFDSLSLEDSRLLQNRKEPPSEGKPQREGVWYGRRIVVLFRKKNLSPAPGIKKKNKNEIGRDFN